MYRILLSQLIEPGDCRAFGSQYPRFHDALPLAVIPANASFPRRRESPSLLANIARERMRPKPSPRRTGHGDREGKIDGK
jgi:hypothetical protein